MPVYEYECPKHGLHEHFALVAERHEAKACPECGHPSLKRGVPTKINLSPLLTDAARYQDFYDPGLGMGRIDDSVTHNRLKREKAARVARMQEEIASGQRKPLTPQEARARQIRKQEAARPQIREKVLRRTEGRSPPDI